MDREHRDELLELTVGTEDEGRRLDEFLGSHPAFASRTQASRVIDEAGVLVDGRARSRSYRLSHGDRIRVSAEMRSESAEIGGAESENAESAEGLPAPEDIEIPVVFEDQWLVVVDKPAGMVVHPAKGHHRGTLVNALASRGIRGGDPRRPGIVHRLDKDTSGLLIVTKDQEAHRTLREMIAGREIARMYLALVSGRVRGDSGTIEAPVGRDPRDRKSMKVDGAGAREAITHFRVRERLPNYTYLEVELETGRTHQIRVHFRAIGHPVVGDATYSRKDELGVGRQFLHSYHLSFRHPVTTQMIDVTSPLPQDLSRALERAHSA